LVNGDGYKKNNDYWSYTTASKELANNIQELGLKSGFTSTISWGNKSRKWHGVSFHKNFITKTYKRKITNYNDKVYCLEVPNHVIYIRRNGKTCWSGNCYKGNRKALRDSHVEIDWQAQYKAMEDFNTHLAETTDWHFIKISNFITFKEIAESLPGQLAKVEENKIPPDETYGIEADDIQAVACQVFADREVILVTGDADLEQLAYFGHVKIFSMNTKFKGAKGCYKIVEKPLNVLSSKIKKGDVSDNISVGEEDTEDALRVRRVIVDLMSLPNFVFDPIAEQLMNLPFKIVKYSDLPFPRTLGTQEEFDKIYNVGLMSYLDAIKSHEKTKEEKKIKDRVKRQLKKAQAVKE